MFPRETVTTGAPNPGTEPDVMSTPGGHYVGYRDKDGLPYTRETGYTNDLSIAQTWLEQFKSAIAVSYQQAQQLPFVRR